MSTITTRDGDTASDAQDCRQCAGLPIAVFDKLRAAVQADRSQFWNDLSLSFYSYNRPQGKISQGVRNAFWRQGMMAGFPVSYFCIAAFSETDLTVEEECDVYRNIQHLQSGIFHDLPVHVNSEQGYAADYPWNLMRRVRREHAGAAFSAENNRAMSKMVADLTMQSTGDVDRNFVASMVPHHQGAIDMAVVELHYDHNEPLRRIAQEIIVQQRQEIAAMRVALGQPLPHSAPPSASTPKQ